MAKVVNVHRIDNEVFYLVRLTPQEIAPLLPAELDAENLPEGQVFMGRREERIGQRAGWLLQSAASQVYVDDHAGEETDYLEGNQIERTDAKDKF